MRILPLLIGCQMAIVVSTANAHPGGHEHTSTPHAPDNVEIGKPLPELDILQAGQLHYDKKNDKITYSSWNSSTLKGKPYIVQYLPARSNTGQMNVPLNDALLAIDKQNRCRIVSVVDVNDHDWGTGIFIKGAMESNFKRTPLCVVVADNNGVGKKVWSYKDLENVTMIIDKDGIVKYEYVGKLNKLQIKNIIKLLDSLPGWK
ncbi:putative protein YtfJ [BD1-7 clade bacterium]|uniref:Thioredoxin domain-containing protein n=1 Tax=BD1-7 clade bacterium TaxID=2029982 RepID=A0A5S9QMH3_9GAMM|nr:putative protein YtfJ [BD1-7 clade bacterium]